MAYDAIVIGAGPAGGTAALMLARAGWSVALVEKRSFPRPKLCGEYVSATTLPVLRELLGDAILEIAGPEVRRAALFAGESELAFPMPKLGNGAAGCWGISIDREQLDLLLLRSAACAGATVWQPWSAAGLERHGQRWFCHLKRRQNVHSVSAPVVIAASGSWEPGPVPAGAGGEHRAGDLLAFKGHFVDCALPDDLMPLLAFPGGYGGMVHSGRDGVNLSCCIRRDVLADVRSGAAERAGDAVLMHLLASSRSLSRVFHSARLDGSWLAAGPINPGTRTAPGEGLFLVGNLAGEAHPIVAEGISMAIQSAWLLCKSLISGQDEITDGRVLAGTSARYAAEWGRCFAGRLRAASWFARLAMDPRSVGMLLPFLERVPGLLTVAADLSGKSKEVYTVP